MVRRTGAGLSTAVLLVVLGVVLAVAVGSWASAIGLRTGSAEAVQNSFPLVFILLFISSAFFPTDLMHGVYQKVAEYNPLSWMINGARDLVIDGFSWAAAAQAIGIAAILLVLTASMAVRQLQKRLEVAS